MNWLNDLAKKTQANPFAGFMSGRLHGKPRKYSDEERDELLVKIDILTARNNSLLNVANIDETQQEGQIFDDEINILKILAAEDEASAYQIAQAFDFSLARAQYHLTRLSEMQFLVSNTALGRQAYLLDQRGREYLAANDPA